MPASPSRADDKKPIIRLKNLTKVFDGKNTVKAVDNISFDIQEGEIFGFLGPNGAGKSTTIRMLTTLITPTSGTAWIGGYRILADDEKIRSIIGVCPQNSTLDTELTAYENLAFYGRIVNVDESILDTRIKELLSLVGLLDRAHVKVSTFSGGMRRKLEIVRTFIHNPRILFLDEPTIGLDPDSRRDIWEHIIGMSAQDTTIILTTHYLEEAERLCHRIAFIDEGRLISLDTPDNLKRALPEGEVIEIGLSEPLRQDILTLIQNHDLIISVEQKENQLKISTKDSGRLLPVIISELAKHNVDMVTVSIRKPTLEDVFVYLTGKQLDSNGKK